MSGGIAGIRIPPTPSDIDLWTSQILPPSSGELTLEEVSTLEEVLLEVGKLDQSPSLLRMALVLASPGFQRQ